MIEVSSEMDKGKHGNEDKETELQDARHNSGCRVVEAFL
jgi:hypothetical protein